MGEEGTQFLEMLKQLERFVLGCIDPTLVAQRFLESVRWDPHKHLKFRRCQKSSRIVIQVLR